VSRSRRALPTACAAFLILTATLGWAGRADAVPGPAKYPEYWWNAWHIAQLWSAGARGQGITVALIDTGVQDITELHANLRPGIDLTGLGGDGRTDRDTDRFSHGTAMASIIAAREGPGNMQGVAPETTILPIAVPLNGVQATQTEDQTAAAIDYADNHGANIISMSFGARRNRVLNADDPCPADVQHAIFRALTDGVLVVAASGNDGTRIARSPNPASASASFPSPPSIATTAWPASPPGTATSPSPRPASTSPHLTVRPSCTSATAPPKPPR
jgi:subtilisin family serine protease